VQHGDAVASPFAVLCNREVPELPKTRMLVATLAVIAAGCSTITIDLPPITESPTGEKHVGKVVWHDLLTNTPEESRHFYHELFGWEFEKPGLVTGIGNSDTYMLIRHNGRLIGGMLDTNAIGKRDNVSQWVTTLSVADIDAAVADVRTHGGEVLTPPTSVSSRGRMAVAADSTGALFALLETRSGDPADSEPEYDGWLWDELWTSDVDTASTFYEDVVGFQHTDHAIDGSDRKYRVLKYDDKPRAGVQTNPFAGQRPVWVNYIRVQDPAAVTARVAALGGKVLVEAQARPIGGEVAFIAGPSGAGVALQTWPLDRE